MAAVSPYDVLGVAETATAAEIRQAYLDLARVHHPDRADHDDAEAAAKRMKEINAAFAVLGDVSSRAMYDEHQRRRAAEPPDEPGWGLGHYGLAHEAGDVDHNDVFPDGRMGRPLPGWVTIAPASVLLLAAVAFVLGMLLRWLALFGVALGLAALGAVLFVAVPMFAMARAARYRD